VLLGAPADATIVPAKALLSKAQKTRWLAAAALAAVPIVFEACGGNGGGFENLPANDAGPDGADGGAD
jgi:hypothetical protein